jgi:hypothetical protein
VLGTRLDAQKRLDKVTRTAYILNMSNENDNYEYYDMIRSFWLEQARRQAVAIDTLAMKGYLPPVEDPTRHDFTDADKIRAHSWGVAL